MSAQPDTKYEALQQIGTCTYGALLEMVEALECDYDRLEELRDERDGYTESWEGYNSQAERWAVDYADDAAELKELETAAGECKDRDDAAERIQQDPLSVEVRSDWYSPGAVDDDTKAAEFCILLGTGGPATRIRGELDESLQPYRAWLEVQDWGTPWTQYHGASQDTLLTYCQQFYFGE